jgi:predicted nucleic acid-binding protein
VKEIFLDTGAWVAMTDSTDTHHPDASTFMNAITGQYTLVTSNYVLDETLTLMLMNVGYLQTVTLKRKIDQLAHSAILQIVWVHEELADYAWQMFERFNVDKQWSFTDCVSFAVMQQRGIIEAFAFDRHFDQMGLVRLQR